MEPNQERTCPRCGTTNYGVMHSCLKCGALLTGSTEDAETLPESTPNRFEAPTILDAPPDSFAHIEITSGVDKGNRYAITPGITFGRSKNCDIVIDSPKASREHARIDQNKYQQWLLVDLGSTNGTLLNGKRIFKPSVLYNGDLIEIGDFEFEVTINKLFHAPTPPDLETPIPEAPQKHPLQPLPPRKGCLSNAALITTGILLLMMCGCAAIYFGYHFLMDQGFLNFLSP